MGFPLFRFTLNNSVEGSLQIDEPGGWDEAVLKLERDKDYHSLIEFYDQPLLFYSDCNRSTDGGLTYIRNIEQTQGPEAVINLTVEISEDEGGTYETLFEGVLDLSTVKEIDFYKIECGVLRNDFWSKFKNRKAIPVSLTSNRDLDGSLISVPSSFTLPLPSQKVREKYQAITVRGDDPLGEENTITTGEYWQLDFLNEIVSEIEEKFSLPTDTNPEEPVSLWDVVYAGSYDFDIKIYAWLNTGAFPLGGKVPLKNPLAIPPYDYADFVLNIDGTEYTFSHAEVFYNGIDGSNGIVSRFTYSGTHNIPEKGQIKIYAKLNDTVSSGGFNFNWLGSITNDDSEITILGDTLFSETETDAFLIKDAGESILSKLVGDEDVLQSDYLTSGCGSKYALMKGLHVRGYTFTDKPFFMSFDQWWNGANPIFNLGLGYERGGSPETDKIRIEQKAYFYDPNPILFLDSVNNIERRYDLEKIFRSIEIGYNKWSAESASGVDDPQTKRTWRTDFATVGKDEKILSQFIAASLAIEQTRRNRIEQGKDWRLDEEIMIIALSEGSPLYVPEFDENFSTITNLLNSDFRYNIRLSCARNFKRWQNVFNGCMQWQNGTFNFSSGEGNYDMTSQLLDSDCDAIGGSPEPILNEKGNISSTDEFLFIPVVYEFEYPLTFEQYKQIRDNRTKAIGVSRTDSNHVACHILNLDYQITRGKGIFTVILAENAYL